MNRNNSETNASMQNKKNADSLLKVFAFGGTWISTTAVSVLINIFAISKDHASGQKETGVCAAISFGLTSLAFLIAHYQEELKACLPNNPCSGLVTSIRAMQTSTLEAANEEPLMLKGLHEDVIGNNL